MMPEWLTTLIILLLVAAILVAFWLRHVLCQRCPADDPDADATDYAHPAWWRGHDHTAAVFCSLVSDILDGRDAGGGFNHEPWHTVRRRLLAHVRLANAVRPLFELGLGGLAGSELPRWTGDACIRPAHHVQPCRACYVEAGMTDAEVAEIKAALRATRTGRHSS